MNVSRLLVVALGAATMSTSASGCGGPCSKIAKYELECGEPSEMSLEMGQSGLEQVCEMAQKIEPESMKNEVACAEEADGCEAYMKCLLDKDAVDDVVEIREATANKDWIQAEVLCERHGDKGNFKGDIKSVCIDMYEAQFAVQDATSISVDCEDGFVARHEELASRCNEALKSARVAEVRKAIEDKSWSDGESVCERHGGDAPLEGEMKAACTDLYAAQLSALVEARDWSSLSSKCEEEFVASQAEIAARCKEALAKGAAVIRVTVTAIRDGKSDEELFSPCYDYKRLAKLISPEASKAAEGLCAEAEQSADADKAIAKAKENLASSEWRIPYHCGQALTELDKLGTEWAAAKKAEVVDACYKQLGVALLKAEVGGVRFCKSAVRDTLAGLAANAISGGEVDALVAEAKKHCK